MEAATVAPERLPLGDIFDLIESASAVLLCDLTEYRPEGCERDPEDLEDLRLAWRQCGEACAELAARLMAEGWGDVGPLRAWKAASWLEPRDRARELVALAELRDWIGQARRAVCIKAGGRPGDRGGEMGPRRRRDARILALADEGVPSKQIAATLRAEGLGAISAGRVRQIVAKLRGV